MRFSARQYEIEEVQDPNSAEKYQRKLDFIKSVRAISQDKYVKSPVKARQSNSPKLTNIEHRRPPVVAVVQSVDQVLQQQAQRLEQMRIGR